MSGNKHDDPMFSLHLMIAEMLGYSPLKSYTVVIVDNYVTGVVLGNKIAEMFYSFCTSIFFIRTAKYNIQ